MKPKEKQSTPPDFRLTYEEAHHLMYLLDDADYFLTMPRERVKQWENICEKIREYRYNAESEAGLI